MNKALALAAIALVGCNDSNLTGKKNTDNGPQPASISGRVCDPSGKNWLADALAYTHYFDDDGRLIETITTYSDPDGFWILDDLTPNVTYRVFVQTGDEIVLDQEIYVQDGDNIRLPEPACFDPLESKVAIITGSYDDFEVVLNQMGFANYTLVEGTAPIGSTSTEWCERCQYHIQDFLRDEDLMSEYDIVMFNGGHLEEELLYDPANPEINCLTTDPKEQDLLSGHQCVEITENIKAYVEGGGNIYASDWAYDVVERAWPERLEFVGDDAVPDDAQVGSYGTIEASLTDAALASWLGKADNPFVPLEFDLPVWPPMEAVDPSVSVHLSGSPEYRIGQNTYVLTSVPMLTSFNAGDGKVVYATFRVSRNASTDMLLILQYMMYNL